MNWSFTMLETCFALNKSLVLINFRRQRKRSVIRIAQGFI